VAERIVVMCDQEQGASKTASEERRICKRWDTLRQVVERLGEPDGVIAFDPSSFPKRGTHSVGVKRQWCSHRCKVDKASR